MMMLHYMRKMADLGCVRAPFAGQSDPFVEFSNGRYAALL
jgi:hypothetical protein